MDMLKTTTRATLALALAAGLAGCGDDDGPAGPDGDLTQAEAEAMTEALFAAGGLGFAAYAEDTEPHRAGPATVPIGPETIDRVVDCPDGGTIALEGEFSGDFSTDGSGGFIDFTLTQAHDACAASASDGSTWTFDGEPNVATDYRYTFSQASASLEGTQTGTVRWAGAGKNGTCSIDLVWDIAADGTEGSYDGSVTGSFCGVEVSQDIELDLATA